ncbi:hypothetical protein STIAU_1324, partial [Stigmatella aurantiaca DW4/3-1]
HRGGRFAVRASALSRTEGGLLISPVEHFPQQRRSTTRNSERSGHLHQGRRRLGSQSELTTPNRAPRSLALMRYLAGLDSPRTQ